jgi:hypothetical protein
MKFLATLLIALIGYSATSFAQNIEVFTNDGNITPYNDARDMQTGITGIRFNADAKWQNFIEKHPGWGATFNAYNDKPHRAVGPGITCAGNGFVDKAINFMKTELAAYKIPTEELVPIVLNEGGKYQNVNFKQVHNGMEIMWSRATFRFDRATSKLVLFGIDIYSDVALSTINLSAQQAKLEAEKDFIGQIEQTIETPAIKIMPVPNGDVNAFIPVFEFEVQTAIENNLPGKYHILVSASSGQILYRANKVVAITDSILGPVKSTNKWSPNVNLPLPYIEMVVGATTYNADKNGIITTPSATGSLRLQGKYVRVRKSGASTTPIAYTTTLGGSNTVFDTAAALTEQRYVNVYHHVNVIHDKMKAALGGYTGLDIQMPANVDLNTATCNAFYNGSSVNFYAEGGACNATSTIADVVYHEYGHAINDFYYSDNGSNFSNGAMGEGYADVWALGVTNHPVIGPGFYLNSSTNGIREYNVAPKVYPVDINGEVHNDGEIIAGAWWDTYQNWGSLDSMYALFGESMQGLATGPNGTEGQVYHDILLDAITYDDNDANINNGTPHFLDIAPAFARHGIFINMYAKFEHTSPHYVPANTAVNLSGTLIPEFPAFIGRLRVYYRLKPGITVTSYTDTIAMAVTTGFNYQATFPAKPEGNLFEYYFEIFDDYYPTSSAATARQNARLSLLSTERNIAYHIIFGMQANIKEDFENGALGWKAGITSDDATAGKWIIAKPIKSKTSGGATIQTGQDHTTGSGICAVTGNATDTFATANSADVDNGVTTLESPVFNLSEFKNPVLSYYRWFSNSQGSRPRQNEIRVVLSDNGFTTTKSIDRTYEPQVGWARMIYRIKDMSFSQNLSNIQLRVYVVDSAAAGSSTIEAAFDDFEILDLASPAAVNNFAATTFKVYPNPASSSFTCNTINAVTPTINVYDAVGKLVFTKSYNNGTEFSVNTQSLRSGVYSVQLVAEGVNTYSQLVVIAN